MLGWWRVESLAWEHKHVGGPAMQMKTAIGNFLVYSDAGKWRCLPPGVTLGVRFDDRSAAMAYAEDYYHSRASSW
jgi:hypothetical protein